MPEVFINASRKPDGVFCHRNARPGRGDDQARTVALLDKAAKLMGEPSRHTLCYSKQFGDEFYYVRKTVDHGINKHSLYFPVDHPDRDPYDPSAYILVKAEEGLFLLYLKDTALAMHQEAKEARQAVGNSPLLVTGVLLAGEADA